MFCITDDSTLDDDNGNGNANNDGDDVDDDDDDDDDADACSPNDKIGFLVFATSVGLVCACAFDRKRMSSRLKSLENRFDDMGI